MKFTTSRSTLLKPIQAVIGVVERRQTMPILANVLALLMLLLGAVSLINLPVAQYPQLTPPTIQVTTSYPGANALTVQQQVARTIEQQVNGVEGMIYMQSNSSNDGRYTLTVTFAVGTNTDQAQVAVQSTLSGMARVLGHVIPLLLMCDPRDVSLHAELKPPETKHPTLYVTESIPGGVGLSDQVYSLFDELLAQAIELVSDCPCQTGCPSCVGAAATNVPRAKKQVLRLLREIRDARGVTRGTSA